MATALIVVSAGCGKRQPLGKDGAAGAPRSGSEGLAVDLDPAIATDVVTTIGGTITRYTF